MVIENGYTGNVDYHDKFQKLNLSDDFMRGMFRENIPLAQLVLRIIVGKKDLVITSCETQAG